MIRKAGKKKPSKETRIEKERVSKCKVSRAFDKPCFHLCLARYEIRERILNREPGFKENRLQ